MRSEQPTSSSRSSLERRKLPSQKRAKATVDRILQATQELIEEEGLSTIGTSKIAARAGVNIASLYQYFPNRNTILYSLYEEAAAQGAEKLNTLAMNIHHETLDVVVPKVLKLLLAHYEEHFAILIRMMSEAPDLRRTARVIPFENMIRSAIRFYLQQHPEYRPKNATRHLFFLENIVVSNLRRYVTNPPNDVSKTEFLRHLTRIINAYLKDELS